MSAILRIEPGFSFFVGVMFFVGVIKTGLSSSLDNEKDTAVKVVTQMVAPWARLLVVWLLVR